MTAVRAGAMGWYKSLSDDSRAAIALGPQMRFSYVGPLALPAKSVDDPELSALCRAWRLWNSGTLRERYESRKAFFDLPDNSPGLDFEIVCARYPLIHDQAESMILSNQAHALMYVNAAYAAANEGSK